MYNIVMFTGGAAAPNGAATPSGSSTTADSASAPVS